jgi:hypothetical protein
MEKKRRANMLGLAVLAAVAGAAGINAAVSTPRAEEATPETPMAAPAEVTDVMRSNVDTGELAPFGEPSADDIREAVADLARRVTLDGEEVKSPDEPAPLTKRAWCYEYGWQNLEWKVTVEYPDGIWFNPASGRPITQWNDPPAVQKKTTYRRRVRILPWRR